MAEITLIQAGLVALLDSPVSPVGRYVTVKAEAVAEIARQNVQNQFHVRTSNLLQSIGVFPRETPDGLEAEVGTDGAPYGRYLEEGTNPHFIFALKSGTYLWSLAEDPNHPDPLYRHKLTGVAHPGNPARPWLRPALEQVFGV